MLSFIAHVLIMNVERHIKFILLILLGFVCKKISTERGKQK